MSINITIIVWRQQPFKATWYQALDAKRTHGATELRPFTLPYQGTWYFTLTICVRSRGQMLSWIRGLRFSNGRLHLSVIQRAPVAHYTAVALCEP